MTTTFHHEIKNKIPIPHVQLVYSCTFCHNPKFIITEINHILSGICVQCGQMIQLTEIVLDREVERKKHSPESIK